MKTQLITDYQKFSDLALKVSWVLLALLIINLVATHLIDGVNPLFRIAVSCFPLVILVPGLLKGRRRSASLLCFALLLYFVVFVSALGVPGNLVSEIISTTLTTLLFTSSMMFSTWQYRADLKSLEESIEETIDETMDGQMEKQMKTQSTGELRS